MIFKISPTVPYQLSLIKKTKCIGVVDDALNLLDSSLLGSGPDGTETEYAGWGYGRAMLLEIAQPCKSLCNFSWSRNMRVAKCDDAAGARAHHYIMLCIKPSMDGRGMGLGLRFCNFYLGSAQRYRYWKKQIEIGKM